MAKIRYSAHGNVIYYVKTLLLMLAVRLALSEADSGWIYRLDGDRGGFFARIEMHR
jgi:hypothetical protein